MNRMIFLLMENLFISLLVYINIINNNQLSNLILMNN